MFEELEAEAARPLLDAGIPREQVQLLRSLDMRYHGQGHEIEVALEQGVADATTLAGLAGIFRDRYEALYAFAFLDAPLVITNWKVEARGPTPGLEAGYRLAGVADGEGVERARKGTRRAWFDGSGGYVDTPVLDRYALREGDRIDGPAMVEERESTLVIPPGNTVSVDACLNLVAELDRSGEAS